MKTSTILAVGALAFVTAGIVGLFAFDQFVRIKFDTTIANLESSTPTIASISYEDLELDYVGDALTVHNSTITYEIDQALSDQDRQDGKTLSGTGSLKQDVITVHGLWGLIFGNKAIPLLRVDAGEVNFDMTTSTPKTVEVDGVSQVMTFNEHMQLSLTFGDTRVEDLSWAETFKDPSVNPLGMKAKYLEAKDYALQTNITTKGVGPAAQDLMDEVSVGLDVKLARVVGHNFEPEQVKMLRYEGLDITVSPAGADAKPLQVSIDAMGFSDLVFDGELPVKMSSYVDGFLLDPNIVTDPKAIQFMEMFGIDELKFNVQVAYEFDEETQSLSVAPFSFGARKVGQVELGFNLHSLPWRAYLDDVKKLGTMKNDPTLDPVVVQEHAEAVLEKHFNDIAISSLSLGYADDGLLKKYLAMQASETNADPAKMARGLSTQAYMLVSQSHGPQSAQVAQNELGRFLLDPTSITVQLSSDQPLKVKELVEGFAVRGPQVLNQFELSVQAGGDL
ncbi:hypothetical protein V5T82_06670 [Magnetovibrio sp. PR-2]|uniref:hypothetical protein n=1 Tax=Magnetovibrio sp. PR-2 TaxID=3120356 RepID=UPI002FCE1714